MRIFCKLKGTVLTSCVTSIHVWVRNDDTNRETTGDGAGLWKQL